MLRLQYLSLGFCSFLLAACSSSAGLDTLTADIAQPAPLAATAADENTATVVAEVAPSGVEASAEMQIADRLASPADIITPEGQPGAAVIASVAPLAKQAPDLDAAPPVAAYAASDLPAVAPATHFEKKGAVKPVEARSAELNALISKYAAIYDVPETLVHRVVKRESNYDPKARNKIYWGLMQIRHDTAQTMGYRGPASGLLDAETNLKYAVKYLRGAYITADRNEKNAVGFYARGYYYDAKRKGLLKVTGLRP